MLTARYLPVSGWYRGGLCVAWTALWAWLAPFAIDRVMGMYYGYGPTEAGPLHIGYDLRVWDDGFIRPWNVYVLVLLALAGFAAVLFIIGWIRGRRNDNNL